MSDTTQKLTELIKLTNNYPSPHNGQPMQLKQLAANELEIYFDTSRGLVAAPISHLFSFVTIGVFVQHLEYCAQALGHSVAIALDLPTEGAMGTTGLLRCATVIVTFDIAKPDAAMQSAIKNRQTSRKKYDAGLSTHEQDAVNKVVEGYGLKHHFLTPDQAHQTVWLNQRAVFDDMFDPAVRNELAHWLRFTDTEKRTKKDGLAYDCMELSGSALKAAVKYYRILHWPIVAPVLQRYYLRTMKDDSSVGYIAAPFETELQAYTIGRCIIDIWLELTRSNKYLHPFGTIVSNDKAHEDFVKLVGLKDESRNNNYAVFIYRAGHSPVPVKSERLPFSEHLFQKEKS